MSITYSTMLKRIVEISVLASFLAFVILNSRNSQDTNETAIQAKETIVPECCTILHSTKTDEQEEIRNEIFYGELEELAILVQAESGNQDELGKRYVADCVLNRVDDKAFPDTIHDVIYQINPTQFSTVTDGSYEKAEYSVTEDCFQIVLDEYENRTDSEIIYFRTDKYSDSGHKAFKHGDHYFSTR